LSEKIFIDTPPTIEVIDNLFYVTLIPTRPPLVFTPDKFRKFLKKMEKVMAELDAGDNASRDLG
jgi:hypothetical protein